MRFLAAPLALLLGLSAPAYAADLGPAPMPTKAPPPVVEAVDYTPFLVVGLAAVVVGTLCGVHVICPKGGGGGPLSP
jgi:hypothetical protein